MLPYAPVTLQPQHDASDGVMAGDTVTSLDRQKIPIPSSLGVVRTKVSHNESFQAGVVCQSALLC